MEKAALRRSAGARWQSPGATVGRSSGGGDDGSPTYARYRLNSSLTSNALSIRRATDDAAPQGRPAAFTLSPRRKRSIASAAPSLALSATIVEAAARTSGT